MLKRFLTSCIICLASLIGYISSVNATTVSAELCDNTSGPTLELTTPLSDSVVNVSNIKLQGTAIRTTQIEISLNGSYSSSLAIGASERIDTAIALTRGTNTIRLDAYYSCNQTTTTKTIVITFEPSAAPSVGSGTNTSFPPTSRPVGPGSAPVTPDQPQQSDDQTPGSSRTPIEEVKRDPGSFHGPNWMPPVPIVTALIAPSLLLLALERSGGHFIGGVGRKISRLHRWLIRGSGIFLAGLLAAIL